MGWSIFFSIPLKMRFLTCFVWIIVASKARGDAWITCPEFSHCALKPDCPIGSRLSYADGDHVCTLIGSEASEVSIGICCKDNVVDFCNTAVDLDNYQLISSNKVNHRSKRALEGTEGSEGSEGDELSLEESNLSSSQDSSMAEKSQTGDQNEKRSRKMNVPIVSISQPFLPHSHPGIAYSGRSRRKFHERRKIYIPAASDHPAKPHMKLQHKFNQKNSTDDDTKKQEKVKAVKQEERKESKQAQTRGNSRGSTRPQLTRERQQIRSSSKRVETKKITRTSKQQNKSRSKVTAKVRKQIKNTPSTKSHIQSKAKQTQLRKTKDLVKIKPLPNAQKSIRNSGIEINSKASQNFGNKRKLFSASRLPINQEAAQTPSTISSKKKQLRNLLSSNSKKQSHSINVPIMSKLQRPMRSKAKQSLINNKMSKRGKKSH